MRLELSERQRECLGLYGWHMESNRKEDDNDKIAVYSRPNLRLICHGFVQYALDAGYSETPYRSTAVARVNGDGLILAATAKDPAMPESHMWVTHGRDLGDFVRFVDRAINPILFGINNPDEPGRGIKHYLVDLSHILSLPKK